MIRRSPTRIELKLDDLQDFDYIQKAEKKKTPSAGVTVQEAQKLLRQERIGFRPLRSATSGIPAVVFASGVEAAAALINSFGNGGATIPATGTTGTATTQNGNTVATPSTTSTTAPAAASSSVAVATTAAATPSNGNVIEQITVVTPAATVNDVVDTPTTAATAESATTSAVDMSMSISFDD